MASTAVGHRATGVDPNVRELEEYREQLQHVDDALRRDPQNAELTKLRQDLLEVIALFETLVAGVGVGEFALTATTTTSTTKTKTKPKISSTETTKRPADGETEDGAEDGGVAGAPKRHVPSWMSRAPRAAGESKDEGDDGDDGGAWQAGQVVLARYSDGKFYEAAVVGPHAGTPGVYDVVFRGYDDVEQVSSDAIRTVGNGAVDPSNGDKDSGNGVAPFGPDDAVGAATAATVTHGDDGQRRHKKKKARRDGPSRLEQETLERQSAWLKFVMGGARQARRKGSTGSTGSAGTPIGSAGRAASAAPAPLKRRSMFSTPDDPGARVGVIGSGRPMTQFQSRGRHVFNLADGDDQDPIDA